MNVIELHKAGRKFKTLHTDVTILDLDFHISHGSFILFKLSGRHQSADGADTVALCNNDGHAFTATGLARRPELDLILIPEKVTKYTIVELVTPDPNVSDQSILNINLLSLLYSSRDAVVSLCANNSALRDTGIIAKVEWEQ